MNVNEVAQLIGVPLDEWAGHCYQVVAAFLETDILEGAVPATGFFTTPEAYCDHAWLKLPDGRICDPTRFQFEARRPYIFFGQADECYDEDGVQHSAEMERLRAKFYPPRPDLVDAFNEILRNEKGDI